ncbi:apolipoprotein N-acyltransferase [Bermanella sp. R86510]|uniref:apolipoprotein N-acyltransferase n=1 Tax=unclassified Bermanella TaxID=2627862 RepID=UPI0037C877F1
MDLSWIQRPGFPGHFFALALGALLPFSFAPYGYWILQFPVVALLYFSLQNLGSKTALWRGWWFGLGAYAAGVSWVYVSIHIHSHTPQVPAFIITLAFVAGLAWFFALLTFCFNRFFVGKSVPFLSFAALWVGFEWIRSWFLSGFPWLYLGDAHIDTWLAGFAPVFGVYGISFLVVLISTYSFTLFKQRNWKPALVWLSPWLIGLILSTIPWTSPIKTSNVVAIQGNIPQHRKWLSEEIYPTLEKYRSATEQNWDADLILWPETAITVLQHQAKEYLAFLNDAGQENQTAILTGIPYQQQANEAHPGAYHNSIMGLGLANGIYHKQKLVPFGEYMPLPDSWRPLLGFFNIPMSQFRPGSAQQKPLSMATQEADYSIAPFICYEVVYPDFAAQLAKDSGLMVTISNDAWFGHSIGPKQHLGIAKMRALENGRYLLRATNTGITALIDHKGRIVEQLPQFEYGVLKAQAQIMEGNTPFTLMGSWPMRIIILLILAGIVWREYQKPKIPPAM